MPFRVECHHDEMIVFADAGAEFDINTELVGFLEALISGLDEMPGPTVCIIDTLGISITFGSMTGALSLITHGDLAFLRHHNLIALIVISANTLVSMGVNALHQNQYGALRTMSVDTMDQAFGMARKELALNSQ